MPLYEVEVAHVARRYIEAEDRAAAVAVVAASIIKALELTARRADPSIIKLWEAADAKRKRHLLLRLDRVVGSAGSRSAAAAQRRLERLIEHHQATAQWLENVEATAPPVNPDATRSLAMAAEASHRRWLLDCLK